MGQGPVVPSSVQNGAHSERLGPSREAKQAGNETAVAKSKPTAEIAHC